MSTARSRVVPLPAQGEDVVLDEAGDAYVGCDDGSVWCLPADAPDRPRRVASTGGRPLGLELLGDDRLVVCDSARGLLAMHRRSGAVEVLATHAAGTRLVFCNNASVAADGSVWFTDSSQVHGREEWRHEMVEATGTGRLLRWRPGGQVEEWVTGLDFANGVVVAPDQRSVLVAETGARRIRRLWLTGDRAGHDDVVVDDLPGYPDNMSLGSDGLLWVALASPRVALLERVRRGPRAVRRWVAGLPQGLQPDPKPSVHVQAHDLDPDRPVLVHDLRARPGDLEGFSMVTGVREHHGEVWLASLERATLVRVGAPGRPVDTRRD